MPTLVLRTEIRAPIELCFDLSRSIDLHVISTAHTKEEAIAGRTSGLICLNETITWRARHLGFRQQFTSKITAFRKPELFVDEMVKGAFKSFWHEHRFESIGSATLMIDTLKFESPAGILGKSFNLIFLTGYLRRLLLQ